jgi:hypothetical protein
MRNARCSECRSRTSPLVSLDAMGLCYRCAGEFLRWIATVDLSGRALSRVDYRDDAALPLPQIKVDWAA